MNKFNSRLKLNKCKCGCGKLPTLGCKGYKYSHLPEEIKAANPDIFAKSFLKRKAALNLAKNKKLIRRCQNEKELNKEAENAFKMNRWYLERRKEMTGRCKNGNCFRQTNLKDDKYYRWSICHILPKKLFPSVATHKDNWLEMCQECHQEYDNTWERASKMPIFKIAKEKFNFFKHHISYDEKRKIPLFFYE